MPSSEPLDTMMETFSMVPGMADVLSWPNGSDAPAGLGYPGDLGRYLGRSLGKELIKLPDRDPGGLAEGPDGGPGALGLVLVPHQPDDLPVPLGQLVDAVGRGDLRRHVLRPRGRIGEETLRIDGHRRAVVADVRHGALPSGGLFTWSFRVAAWPE